MTSTIFNTPPLCVNDDGSSIYSVKWSSLSRHNIINWKYNRPYDEVRIPDIKYLLEEQDYVDGIIYLFYQDNNLICYDGIHRIEALKQIKKNNKDHTLFVHYYPIYIEQKIKHKFEMLNKCVPVPNIYSDAEKTLDKIIKIETIVKHFTDKYSKMFKPTSNPNIPHVNRDLFTNQVENILNELNLDIFSVDKIIALFEEYNVLNKNDPRIVKKMTQKQLTKCFMYDCFIFADKQWYVKIIKAYINNMISLKRV